MKTSSLKAKSRVLQDKVREMYRAVGRHHNLIDDDIKATPMGQSGVDILFSPLAKSVFNHSIECKKHAAVRIPFHFAEHYKKYKDDTSLKLLFSENNRSEPLVTMRAEDFMKLVSNILVLEQELEDFQESHYGR